MAENPYFSNIVKPSSGGGRNSFTMRLIGGIAQAHRMQQQHEYAADLIKQRTINDVVGHMLKTTVSTDAEKTRLENRRSHAEELTDKIHSHLSPEERAAAGIGKIDPFLVGGPDFQQLGQSRVGRVKPGGASKNESSKNEPPKNEPPKNEHPNPKPDVGEDTTAAQQEAKVNRTNVPMPNFLPPTQKDI